MSSKQSQHDAGAEALTFDTSSLGRAPGALMHVDDTVGLPEPIGVEMIRLPARSEVSLSLDFACVDEGVLVTGEVTGDATVECARCLGTLTVPVSLQLTEMYAYPGTAAAAGAEADEVRLADGDRIDLFPALLDGFGLEFPLNPTCTDYDAELCVNDGTPAPDGVSGEAPVRIDPRFAGLAEKFGLDPETGEKPDGGPAT